ADLTLVVFDATAGAPDPASLAILDARAIALLNKTDLVREGRLPVLPVAAHPISVVTEAGLDSLLDQLTRRVRDSLEVAGAAPIITRARHRSALERAVCELERASAAQEPELVAESLRLSARALGTVTGRVGVEELLDRIFAEFCIGK